MLIGGGVLAVAAVVRDARVSLKGRACAAGCLKLYMARTPQELIAAGVVSDLAAVAAAGAGPVPGAASGSGPPATAPGMGLDPPIASSSGSAQGNPHTAAGAASIPGASPVLGATLGGLSAAGTAPALQKKPKPPAGKGGVKNKVPAEGVSFALGWFADSGEDDGEERLWLEEQMMVADGVKEKACRIP